MTDAAMPVTDDHANASARSVPAIVTFWLLAIWSVMLVALFWMAGMGLKIEGVMLGLLSGVIGTQTTLLVAAVSFWVGSTVGARQAADKVASENSRSTAALAQIAGAGPQPPAAPLGEGAKP